MKHGNDTDVMDVVLVAKSPRRRHRARNSGSSYLGRGRSRGRGRHVRRRGAGAELGAGLVSEARLTVKAEMDSLLSSGLWRPAWFVAFLSAGSVLQVLGLVWVVLGQQEGFHLVIMGLFFWAAAAVLLGIFSSTKPKPPVGRRR